MLDRWWRMWLSIGRRQILRHLDARHLMTATEPMNIPFHNLIACSFVKCLSVDRGIHSQLAHTSLKSQLFEVTENS
jgi:hypothetical protein